MTALGVPQLSLVVLVGVSGSGKTSFAAQHFGPFEVISSDFCRGLVADDVNDQSATKDAFEVLEFIVGKRLAAGRLTVVDATNVQPDARRKLVELARSFDVLPVAIVLDVPEKVCVARNAVRADRMFGAEVVRRQRDQLRRSMRGLAREGFRKVHVLDGVDAVEEATIVRERLLTDFRDVTGPFDIIGDIHGCRGELESLLTSLAYRIVRDDRGRPVDAAHPDGRTAVFVGDLVDRGPDSPGVLRLAMGMVAAGHARAVPGNHENKLIKALRGRQVQVSHGLAETLAQLAEEPPEFRKEVEVFCDSLVSHLVLDGGRLVVAHAGVKESYQGRASGRVRSFALYGDTTGETDEFGLPVRLPWANDYRGRAMVVYGHTPTPEVQWVNNTLCLDTGCVFGGKLTALRYPEKEIVEVPAEREWYAPARPFLVPAEMAPVRADDDLSIGDVMGRSVVQTQWHGRISVREENAAGALEVMSRFALDPHWLLHLPPTMAPTSTSARGDLLEHPDEAFASYRSDGVSALICQEKHMGSRAVVLLCRDEVVARERFRAVPGETGVIHTRTGRSFFGHDLTEELLARLREAVTTTGIWNELDADWLLLDCELMPWSAKAEDLLRNQYAPVGAAARAVLPVAVSALEQAEARGLELGDLLSRTRSRRVNADDYAAAYRRYVWPTDGLEGLRLAPFQVLASGSRTSGHAGSTHAGSTYAGSTYAGSTYYARDHAWHLALIDRLIAVAPDLLQTTRRLLVDASDPESTAAGVRWWEELTAAGGEGMVVKPLANLTRLGRNLAQPGIKVRGREYLRIIYGPDYTESENLARLRERGIGHKRSMALREYALGLESLDRVAVGEPLWRVHEAVFAVLALESEPIDPRL
ncbi:protein phosphatase [Nakamurella sp. UYEF19]|uniref:polynucleotide kinase-phosphatase n=1 Tax=Nakamurella sp. UYEF19 TaxID=1756392 RepID=UPI003391FDB4